MCFNNEGDFLIVGTDSNIFSLISVVYCILEGQILLIDYETGLERDILQAHNGEIVFLQSFVEGGEDYREVIPKLQFSNKNT